MIHIDLRKNRGILSLILELYMRRLVRKWIKAYLEEVL